MSIPLPRLPFAPLALRGRFNGAASAGPRRIAAIAGCGFAVAALLAGATFLHGDTPTASRSGRLPTVNPLPGGLNSNPQQDTLAVRSSNEAAAEHKAAGQSFTPPIAASQLYQQANARPLLTSPPHPDPVPALLPEPPAAWAVTAKMPTTSQAPRRSTSKVAIRSRRPSLPYAGIATAGSA